MAWKLVAHAFHTIFNNFGQALRVSIGPYLLLLIGYVAILTVATRMNGLTADTLMANRPSAILVFLFIAWVVALVFIMAWVAVSWHRFILLEERAGFLPVVSGRPIWPYVGKSIALALLVMLLAIPMMMIVGAVSMPFVRMSGAGVPVISLLILAAGYVTVGFVALRWAVALPATALDKPISFADAWRATKPISGAIFGVSLILVAINVLPGLLLTGIYAAVPIIAFVVDLALSWLSLMLGIGILTTLYGHLIEGRDLPT